MKAHPLAQKIPPMRDRDFQELVASMRTNGFDRDHPIVTFEGMILDGVHRARAAKQAGVKALFVPWEGKPEKAWDWVRQENLARRHLTDEQWAVVAAREATSPEAKATRGRPRKDAPPKKVSEPDTISKARKSRDKAAKDFNVPVSKVKRAIALDRADHALADAVRDGELTLKQAEEKAGAKKPAKPAKVNKPKSNGVDHSADIDVDGNAILEAPPSSGDVPRRYRQWNPNECHAWLRDEIEVWWRTWRAAGYPEDLMYRVRFALESAVNLFQQREKHDHVD